jgi:hypothetical protein
MNKLHIIFIASLTSLCAYGMDAEKRVRDEETEFDGLSRSDKFVINSLNKKQRNQPTLADKLVMESLERKIQSLSDRLATESLNKKMQ